MVLEARRLAARSLATDRFDATPPPAANGESKVRREWYPIGRILLWIAGFAALATTAALLTLGTDGSAITGTLRRGSGPSLHGLERDAIDVAAVRGPDRHRHDQTFTVEG